MSTIIPSNQNQAPLTPFSDSKIDSVGSETKSQASEKAKKGFFSSLRDHVIRPLTAFINSPLSFVAEVVRALLVTNVILPAMKYKAEDLTVKREKFLEKKKEKLLPSMKTRIRNEFIEKTQAELLSKPENFKNKKTEMERARAAYDIAVGLADQASTKNNIREQAEAEFNARFKHEQISGNDTTAKGLPKQPPLDGFSVSHPGQPADPTKQKWIIFLHGNAGTYENSLDDLESLSNKTGCNVLSANYRGVGNSGPDSPPRSSEDLNEDARHILAHLKNQGVPTENILIHGYSTGGGPAAVLCQENPQLHLCAERTFSRYADVAGTLAGRVGRKVVEATGWRFNSIEALSQTPKLEPGQKIGHRFVLDSEGDGLIRPKARLGAQMAARIGPRLILNQPEPPPISVITLRTNVSYRPQKFVAKHIIDMHGHTAHWYAGSDQLHVKEGERERVPLDVYAEQVQRAFGSVVTAPETKL